MAFSAFTASAVSLYDRALRPMSIFDAYGLPVTTLDFAAVVRLCVALRQLRDMERAQRISASGKIEPNSFLRKAFTLMLVVYGGDTLSCLFIGVTPSVMVSATFPLLYIFMQAIVELIPYVPAPSLSSELPLAILDAFTRSYLLCSLIPPPILNNSSPVLANSPWALLVTSVITGSAGFMTVMATSLLSPTPLTLVTPPEFKPWGWTMIDFWIAPFITGLFALLTHAQPFWIDAHIKLIDTLNALDDKPYFKADAWSPAEARALGFGIMTVLFSFRALKNFNYGFPKKNSKTAKTKRIASEMAEVKATNTKVGQLELSFTSGSDVNEKKPTVPVPEKRKVYTPKPVSKTR